MIVFIADIVHEAPAKIPCFRAAMVYHCKARIDAIDGFQIHSPIEIRKMVAWVSTKDRFTCPTNFSEVSSMPPSCLIVVSTINLAVQVLISCD
jgi:hypothetical protein